MTDHTLKNTSLGATWWQREKEETALLLRSVPALAVSLFIVSVVCMNLLANKTIYQSEWLAIDGGILISWLAFMTMDMIAKHFGPKAATKIALLAVGVNILTCAIFFIVSRIPSTADDYTAFNMIFGGTWFILLSSTIAFIASAVINNVVHWAIGRGFQHNPNGKLAFVTQTYISTMVGQFFDNLIFATLVFMVFAPIYWDGFSWTLLQCVMCALTGAVVELLMEVAFSPFGYKMLQRWRRDGVGQEYLEAIQSASEEVV